MVSFAATLLALKFAESTRGVEFEGWDGVLGTAVVCWAVSWLIGFGLTPFIGIDPWPSPTYAVGFGLAAEFVVTIVALLLSWAFVPGARIKNVFGLVVTAVLVVLFTYSAQMLVAGSGLELL